MQAAIYDGIHSLGYQGVPELDGVIWDLYGPECGRRHDLVLLRKSNFNERLRDVQLDEIDQYVAYADKTYNDHSHLIGAYHGHNVADWKLHENNVMKSMRIGIEWAFGKVTSQNRYIDYYKGMAVGMIPVGRMYRVAVLLANAHSCFYGNQSSLYFNIEPPSIEEDFRINGV